MSVPKNEPFYLEKCIKYHTFNKNYTLALLIILVNEQVNFSCYSLKLSLKLFIQDSCMTPMSNISFGSYIGKLGST